MFSSDKQEMFNKRKGSSARLAVDIIAIFILLLSTCLIFGLAMPHGGAETKDYIIPILTIIACFNVLLYNVSSRKGFIFIVVFVSVYTGLSFIAALFGNGGILTVIFIILSIITLIINERRWKSIAADKEKSESRSVV